MTGEREWSRARVVLFAGLLLIAVVVAFVTIIATASVTSQPLLFLATGWVVFALGACAAVRLVAPLNQRTRIGVATLTILSIVGGFGLLWRGHWSMPSPPPDMRWIDLPSGSHLAYMKLAAPAPTILLPVIFLHGGPGIADMRADASYLRGLAAAGFDVFLYDQLGAGQSTRLADPNGYTLASAVADLDAVRQAIGAERVDLLGYSWGATLAAAYLAAHPNQVAKAVFISPGSMDGGASGLGGLFARLSAWRIAALLWHVLQPRPLLTWEMVQVNPRGAHDFTGDAEMDARFRLINRIAAPALYCHRPSHLTGADPGFYAYAMLLRPAARRDFHRELHDLHTSALIIKGQCDYLSWSSAVDYRDTLPEAKLVYLPQCGHQLFAECPEAFTWVVAEFLDGQPLSFPLVAGSAPPEGYNGPP